jgi:cytochrome c556
MGYRSQGSPRRSAGQRFQKSQHEKAKTKAHKHQVRGRALGEEPQIATSEEIAEKTLNRLKRLGEQKFAVSPFSEYFDDWLINLKEVLSEFESSPAVSVDEAFVNERGRLIAKVERELAELKQDEAALDVAAKELADNNHLLVQIDAEYAAKTREIGPRRNAEIQGLTLNVQSFEGELERVKAMKTSFFSFTKRAKAQKESEALRKLESAKTELESVLQSFKVEQEKFHDDYEKKKQAVIEQVQRLEKEVEKLENDSSLTVRSSTSEALADAVNALLERQPASSTDAAT